MELTTKKYVSNDEPNSISFIKLSQGIVDKTEVPVQCSHKSSSTEPTDCKNCIVVNGTIGKYGHGKATSYDLVRFNNTRDFDTDYHKKLAGKNPLKKTRSIFLKLKSILGLCTTIGILIFVLNYFEFSLVFFTDHFLEAILILIGLICLYLFFPSTLRSKRIIKWTLEEFSEEKNEHFFTSPMIQDKSGQWRLTFCQTKNEQTTFGLIATDIIKNVQNVVVNIEISASIEGHEIFSDSKEIKFVHMFECVGDCGYSQSIRLNFDQLKNKKLDMKYRIYFKWKEISKLETFFKFLFENFKTDQSHLGRNKFCEDKVSSEVGTILQDNHLDFGNHNEDGFFSQPPSMRTGSELEGCKMGFLQYPETKTFFWTIPNFSKYLKSLEYWGVSSPQLFINSCGFCSIWRLQLVELQGVFHLHMQLRGIPKGIRQIKTRYLMELMDNFGEYVIPEHCGITNKFPIYLHLWDITRISLYRRETILERFLNYEDVLTLRVSFLCEPNDTVKINESSDWIL